MYWVIQEDIYGEEGFHGLVRALERFGLPHSIHKVIPFALALEPEVDPPAGQVIVMGSYAMTRIAKARGWNPGAFLNENFDFTVQRDYWASNMLNWNAAIYQLKDVPFQIFPFFIRPVVDAKLFTGKVMDWATFTEWRNVVLASDGVKLSGDTEAMICPKQQILREYRLWIVDGVVVTASVYKSGTLKHYDPIVDEEVINFGELMAAIYSPDRAYVMDVAATADGLKIVEINNLNSAGYYAADMNKLVGALEAMEWDPTYNHTREDSPLTPCPACAKVPGLAG